MERAIRLILKKHRELDCTAANQDVIAADKKYVETLRRQVRKIKEWMNDNDDKPGKTGGVGPSRAILPIMRVPR